MLCVVLAVILFAASVYFLGEWISHKRRCTETVEAMVTAIERNRPGRAEKESKNYYPVYGFNFAGKDYEVRPGEPSRTNKWEVGETVQLSFDPRKPDYFYVGKGIADLVWCIGSFVVCILMILILLAD